MSIAADELVRYVDQLADEAGVADIDRFGYVGGDYDDDFVGYAMWTEQPPCDHDFEAWQDNRSPRRAPTDAEEAQMVLGHDFFGLMKTSRFEIGSALLHRSSALRGNLEPTAFDVHEFGALVALNTAGDRIRDFLIIGVLQARPGEIEIDKQVRELVRRVRTAGIAEYDHRLKTAIDSLLKVKKRRNVAVHELPTYPARVQRRLIRDDRAAFQRGRWRRKMPNDSTYVALKARADMREKAERRTARTRIAYLVRDYVATVTAGDIAFRVEYEFRRRRTTGGPS